VDILKAGQWLRKNLPFQELDTVVVLGLEQVGHGLSTRVTGLPI
jgi:hypothetical protein